MIGSRIGERYEILKSIGDGGMSKVYLAHDIILNRDVAIKVLNYDFANEEELKRRFQREALSATSLTHPHIVDIFDVGEEGELLYLVMEYVEGQTLKKFIQTNGPLSPKQALPIMRQLVSAISNAHHNGIVHRDIKPQNILMDAEGNLKITDFGIAMALSATAHTKTNSVVGTVHYLSPEQARGGMATKKSDIYSLGIVFYELLTGELPFSAETAVAIALKHLQEETPSVRALFPAIPQSVENIILKATTKDAAHRYRSADEMYDDLLTALSSERAAEPKFVVPFDDDRTHAIPVVTEASKFEVLEMTKKVEPVIVVDPPQIPVKKRKKWPLIVGGIAGAFVIVLLLLLLPGLLGPKKEFIPEVAGKTEAEAIDILLEAGFKLEETLKQPSEEFEEGQIIRTIPEEGKKRDVGSAVTLYMSTGKDKVEFEDYTDQDYERVADFLTKKGYKVDSKEAFSDKEPGTILEQDPVEGTAVVPEDTDVVFTISKGKKLQKLEDLRGYDKQALNDYAKTSGLAITVVGEEYSPTVPAGHVIWQTPKQGTDMKDGDKVEVALSKGEEKKPDKVIVHNVTIEYLPEEIDVGDGEVDEDGNWVPPAPPVLVPQEIKIYVQDKTNNMAKPVEVFTIMENTKKKISVELEEGQRGAYMITRDGKIIVEQAVDYNEK
ncbi:Stk1 family PASTA domain-containing Ser/Thr kinase [Sporosarcina beigongshangi]|uniref:Stk1 family PASTA domain-containing Ser/Thr kinase n=1 Tax=Sporosarcina beigongshangi TaxID=2782538 RepID=UPI00193A74E8|nr:Stk1 family PASTA domain-containing Ser/Thr kinase [Sporosarcina beigongshangi]